MTDTGGERVEGPRLPDRSVDDVTRFHLEKSLTPTQIQIQMQLEMDSASRRHVHSPLLSADLPEFEPPKLLKVHGLGYAWIALRVITTLWAIALGIAAVLVRNDAEAGFSDGAIVAKVGFVGALIAYALTVVGGFWSVRLTMNVHRLEGRYPTRNRAVRAWLYPGLWAGLMALTLVRAEPNADFDIRPLIIVTGFMITMWRPYALVRRIFLSLTRTSVDALIGVMYVLDVAGFGLIWWRVANWPEVLTPTNAGTADVMIGVGFATAVAFAAAGLVVILLVRAAETGQAHRMVVLRTAPRSPDRSHVGARSARRSCAVGAGRGPTAAGGACRCGCCRAGRVRRPFCRGHRAVGFRLGRRRRRWRTSRHDRHRHTRGRYS